MNRVDTDLSMSVVQGKRPGRLLRVLCIGMAAILLAATLPVNGAASASAIPSQTALVAARAGIPQALGDSEFLIRTNEARAEVGLPPLTVSNALTVAADAKAQDMVEHGYWNHFRPTDQKAPWDFIKDAGYSYKVAGENLARGFETAGGTTQAWLNSPTHRANLLSEKYTEVGFATVRGTGQNGEPAYITVQMFGSR